MHTTKLRRTYLDLRGEVALTLIALGMTPAEARAATRESFALVDAMITNIEELLNPTESEKFE